MQVRAAKTLFRDATTLPRIPRVRKSPHLRRVELVNVGTSVGCCGSLAGVKNLFDREAEGSRAERRKRGWEQSLFFFLNYHYHYSRACVFMCARVPVTRNESRKADSGATPRIRGSLSNRAQSEMSRTVSASSDGKRD